MSLETHSIQCPYCGEMIEIDVEKMDEPQSLIEDCTVCCRPIQYEINPSEDEEPLDIVVTRSD